MCPELKGHEHQIDMVLGKSLIQAKHYNIKKAAKEVNYYVNINLYNKMQHVKSCIKLLQVQGSQAKCEGGRSAVEVRV